MNGCYVSYGYVSYCINTELIVNNIMQGLLLDWLVSKSRLAMQEAAYVYLISTQNLKNAQFCN